MSLKQLLIENNDDEKLYLCVSNHCKSTDICCEKCISNQHQQCELILLKEINNYIIETIINSTEKCIVSTLQTLQKDIEKDLLNLKQICIQQDQKKLYNKNYIINLKEQLQNQIQNIKLLQTQYQNFNRFIQNSEQFLSNNQTTKCNDSHLDQQLFIENNSLINSQLNNNIITDSNYNKYLQQKQFIEESKIQFTDQEFPPNAKSICEQKDLSWDWARISEMYPQDVRFFPNIKGINPFTTNQNFLMSDIEEGSIGNESLFSLIFLIANQCSDQLFSCFITKECNKEGIYALKLYQNYKQIIITVDDFIPYNFNIVMHSTLLGINNSIWIMILEKGLAKIEKSYINLINAQSTHILQHIIPNCLTFNMNDVGIISLIEREINQKSVLITSFKINDDYPNPYFQFALQIIAIKKVNLSNNQQIKICQLKSHLATKLQNIISSNLQTQSIRQHFNDNDQNKNLFYMDIKQITIHLQEVIIIKKENYLKILEIYSKTKQATYLKLTIQKLDIYSLKIVSSTNLINLVQIVICRQEQDGSYQLVSYFHQHYNHHSGFLRGFQLSPGEYKIYLKIFWNNEKLNQATLELFCHPQTQITQIQKVPNLLHEAFGKETNLIGENQADNYENLTIKRALFNNIGFACFYISNNGQKPIQLRKFEITQYVPFKASKHLIDGFILQQMSKQIVLLKFKPNELL